MLKVILVLGSFLLSNLVLVKTDDDAMSYKDIEAALEPMGSDCVPPPTKDDLRDFIYSKKDANHSTKCFRLCLMRKFELMEADSTQMDKEKSKGMMEMVVEDEAMADKMIDDCNTKNAAVTDGCEAAHDHSMCMLELFEKNGIQLPKIKE